MRDSIIMNDVVIGQGAVLDHCIVAEKCHIGERTNIGVGEFAESKYDKKVYNTELTVIGEKSVIPNGVSIGRNVAIMGVTDEKDYPNGYLESGGFVIKAGEE